MRAKLLAAMAVGMACGAACVIACASFTDGGAVAQGSDAEGGVDPADGPAPLLDGSRPPDAAALPALSATCPASRAPSCGITACSQHIVAMPAAGDPQFPFAIATDAADVYWVAQSADDAGGDPYNGTGSGRVFRHGKKSAGPAFEIASEQPSARALALDGDFVYWNIRSSTRPVHPSAIRRARRDCVAAPCVVEEVAALDGNVTSLLRAQPGKLIGVTDEGDVFLLDTTTAVVGFSPAVTKVGAFPALAATDVAAYASSALGSPLVQRIDFATGAVSPAFATVPDGGAEASAPNSNPGISPTTTDCASVWGLRQWSTRRDLYELALDGGLADYIPLDVSFDPIAMAADAENIYFGRQNGGGVYALAKAKGSARTPVLVAGGNVWRIAVDDDGVYWGEHDSKGPGAIFMLSK